jgi:hypothetical protein
LDEGSRNPFEVTLLEHPASVAAEGDFEYIRQKYLGHETSVRSLALIFGLLGVFVSLWLLAVFIGFLANGVQYRQFPDAVEFLIFVIIGGLATFLFAVASGLRRLKPWSRIAGAVISFFGLLFFPIGTIANGYFLYLLLSKKGSMVFSDHYQNVISATPGMKYKTSRAAWIVLVAFLMVVGLLIAFLFVGIRI